MHMQIFIAGILGGAYIGLGSLLMMSVGGNCAGLATTNPGLKAMISGLIGLPCGLLLVLVTGSELFTGNTALVTLASMEGKASLGQLFKSMMVSWTGNLVGSIILASMAAYAGVLSVLPSATALATAKTSMAWGQAFVRGILCNWLVCMAIFMANGEDNLVGKAVGIIFPIPAFVAMGLEHSVANMFIIPAGILSGAQVSWGNFFWNNLLPVTLGNTVAGMLLVAAALRFTFGPVSKA